MSDPTFWATIGAAAVQLPGAIKALRDLATGAGASDNDVKAAYEEIAGMVSKLGEAITFMQAWKRAHDLFQTLLDSYLPIYSVVVQEGKGNALNVAATVKPNWELYRTNTLPRIFTEFSTREGEIVRLVSIMGENSVDWIELLKGLMESATKNLDRNNCSAFWENLRDIEDCLKQLLSRADRELVHAIGEFSVQWMKIEHGFSHV